MAAPKQRRVTDVIMDDEGVIRVTAIDHNGKSWTNPLRDVKSTTLRSIPKVLGINMWQGATMDEMRDAIVGHFMTGGQAFHAKSEDRIPPKGTDDKPRSEPEAPKAPSPLDTPIPNPEGLEMYGSMGADFARFAEGVSRFVAAGVVSEALEGLSESLPSLNDDELKTLVEDSVLNAIDELRPLQITYKDRPVVEIDDHVHPVFEEVLDCLAEGENVMLVGPAGTGKSTLGEHLAKALALTFRTISCGPSLGEHAFIGYRDATGGIVRTPYFESHTEGGLFLIDEIDAASEDSLIVMNAGLSNKFMAFPDGTFPKHEDHIVVASANTFGTGADAQYVGRAKLDKATLDRFVMIPVDYDTKFEMNFAKAHGADEALVKALWKMRDNCEAERAETIVSTRGIMAVAKLVSNRGWTFDRAVDRRIFGGTPKLQRDRIMAGVAYGK